METLCVCGNLVRVRPIIIIIIFFLSPQDRTVTNAVTKTNQLQNEYLALFPIT